MDDSRTNLISHTLCAPLQMYFMEMYAKLQHQADRTKHIAPGYKVEPIYSILKTFRLGIILTIFFIPFSILDRIMSAKPSPMCSESIESRFISCPIWEHFMQNKLLAFTVPVDVIEHRPTDVCQCLTLKYKFEIDAEMCFTLSPISICHCRR